jgi:hypothetical protein
MLKNGVRFHSFTPHAGPDTYTGDMEKTVWWKERGLDRTGGRAILRNKDSLSMSKDIRVRRNGRHRCETFSLPPSRLPIPLHLHAVHLARPTCWRHVPPCITKIPPTSVPCPRPPSPSATHAKPTHLNNGVMPLSRPQKHHAHLSRTN